MVINASGALPQMIDDVTEESYDEFMAASARGPFFLIRQPEDIAGVVAFLAGPDSGWISGQNLSATGGFLP